MSQRFVFGIDIDGVLRNFDGSLARVYAREFPDHVVPEVSDWDLHKFYPIGDDIYHFAFELHGHQIMCDAEPYQGAKWFIREIERRYHRVVLVTTQPANLRESTLVWLRRRGLQDLQLCFLSDKGLANVDFLLDDHIKNLNAVRIPTIPIAFDRPWNHAWLGERVHSFTQFIYNIDSDYYERLWHEARGFCSSTTAILSVSQPTSASTAATADSPTTSPFD